LDSGGGHSYKQPFRLSPSRRWRKA
jgi:hypothetical protein